MSDGHSRFHWVDTDDVMAMAFDTPVPGYGTNTVNNMRLWSAKASRDFNLKYFNEGNYIKAVEEKNESENLSKVLYPDDSTQMGRELRLKQQYFFVCASLEDILRRLYQVSRDLDDLPDKVAIQLNDTHPSIAIPELMRVLLDVHHLDWDRAWDITSAPSPTRTIRSCPRRSKPGRCILARRPCRAIFRSSMRSTSAFSRRCGTRIPATWNGIRMSIIDEKGSRRLRMAHLAVVGSHRVNGVSTIHTELMKQTIFADFDPLSRQDHQHHERHHAPAVAAQGQPGLSALITRHIGEKWVSDLAELKKLVPFPRTPGSGGSSAR